MLIRPATPEDYPAYCSLISECDLLHALNMPRYYRDTGSLPRTMAQWEALLADTMKAEFFAERDGQVLGYLCLADEVEPDLPMVVQMNWVGINAVVVAKAHQRQGVGRALVEHARTWAKDKGARDLRVSVAEFNGPAKAFYAKMGFGAWHQTLALPLDL